MVFVVDAFGAWLVEQFADATAEGCTPIEIQAASYVTEACCPSCAVTAWADRLAEESAS